MTGIAVFGCEGRMGRLVSSLIKNSSDLELCAGYDIFQNGLSADNPLPGQTDVVIDFSSPSAWEDLDRLLSGSAGVSLVSGTTGLEEKHREKLRKWSEKRAVFYSPNMSRGIFALGRLLEKAAEMLSDEGFDIEIVEIHHRGKLDNPSGTALHMAEIWREQAGSGNLLWGRHGRTAPRNPEDICMHAVRGGDVVGEHQVHLLGNGERLILSHQATSRNTFALGALAAARFVAGLKSPGFYVMEDLFSVE